MTARTNATNSTNATINTARRRYVVEEARASGKWMISQAQGNLTYAQSMAAALTSSVSASADAEADYVAAESHANESRAVDEADLVAEMHAAVAQAKADALVDAATATGNDLLENAADVAEAEHDSAVDQGEDSAAAAEESADAKSDAEVASAEAEEEQENDTAEKQAHASVKRAQEQLSLAKKTATERLKNAQTMEIDLKTLPALGTSPDLFPKLPTEALASDYAFATDGYFAGLIANAGFGGGALVITDGYDAPDLKGVSAPLASFSGSGMDGSINETSAGFGILSTLGASTWRSSLPDAPPSTNGSYGGGMYTPWAGNSAQGVRGGLDDYPGSRDDLNTDRGRDTGDNLRSSLKRTYGTAKTPTPLDPPGTQRISNSPLIAATDETPTAPPVVPGPASGRRDSFALPQYAQTKEEKPTPVEEKVGGLVDPANRQDPNKPASTQSGNGTVQLRPGRQIDEAETNAAIQETLRNVGGLEAGLSAEDSNKDLPPSLLDALKAQGIDPARVVMVQVIPMSALSLAAHNADTPEAPEEADAAQARADAIEAERDRLSRMSEGDRAREYIRERMSAKDTSPWERDLLREFYKKYAGQDDFIVTLAILLQNGIKLKSAFFKLTGDWDADSSAIWIANNEYLLLDRSISNQADQLHNALSVAFHSIRKLPEDWGPYLWRKATSAAAFYGGIEAIVLSAPAVPAVIGLGGVGAGVVLMVYGGSGFFNRDGGVNLAGEFGEFWAKQWTDDPTTIAYTREIMGVSAVLPALRPGLGRYGTMPVGAGLRAMRADAVLFWRSHSIEIAYGRGDMFLSPIHVAWRVGDKTLHADGTKPLFYFTNKPGLALELLGTPEGRAILFKLQTVSANRAAGFFEKSLNANRVFRLPAIRPSLALLEGHETWSCVTAAIGAWNEANYCIPAAVITVGGTTYVVYLSLK